MTGHLNLDDDGEVREPSCTFTFAGRDWRCRNAADVPFRLREKVFQLDGDGENASLVVFVEPFFRGVLVPEDFDAFKAHLDEPDSPLTEAKFQKLIEFVSEKVFGRPTEPSASSSAGPSARGRSSKGRSSSPGTPRLASTG